MNTHKAYLVIIIPLSTVCSILVWQVFFGPLRQEPHSIVTPENRGSVLAKGSLHLHNYMKVGSLVTGRVKHIYVEENDRVKKGQLLARIDRGIGNTDVEETKAELERAQALLTYQERFFKRQEILYKGKQISADTFEKTLQDHRVAKNNVAIARAKYEKTMISWNNEKILAPDDGIVLRIGVRIGESVSTDLDATVLFEIARDTKKMDAQLEIYEKHIGHVTSGAPVTISVVSYPNMTLHGTVEAISYIPQKVNGSFAYKAVVCVENNDDKLRPGMTVNAHVKRL